MDKMEVI